MTKDEYTYKHEQLEALANFTELSMDAIVEMMETMTILVDTINSTIPPEGVDFHDCQEKLRDALGKMDALGLLLKSKSEYYN